MKVVTIKDSKVFISDFITIKLLPQSTLLYWLKLAKVGALTENNNPQELKKGLRG